MFLTGLSSENEPSSSKGLINKMTMVNKHMLLPCHIRGPGACWLISDMKKVFLGILLIRKIKE